MVLLRMRNREMGHEIYYFKTGFTKSQRADSARANGPGILTFSADPQCPLPELRENDLPKQIAVREAD